MAVRKIPIKERSYLLEHSLAPPILEEEEDKDTRPDDPTVTLYLEKIRKTLLSDRAIHDQVRTTFFA